MSTTRKTRIEDALRIAFTPETLLVKDQSHMHAGHAGSADGRGHFEIHIVADAFAGVSRIQSHKMVYAALEEMMTSDIHALSIRAGAPASAHAKSDTN